MNPEAGKRVEAASEMRAFQNLLSNANTASNTPTSEVKFREPILLIVALSIKLNLEV